VTCNSSLNEASGGGTNISSSNIPQVQVRRIDSELTLWSQPHRGTVFSSSAFTGGFTAPFQAGPAAVTVFVAGIPSVSKLTTFESCLPAGCFKIIDKEIRRCLEYHQTAIIQQCNCGLSWTGEVHHKMAILPSKSGCAAVELLRKLD